MITVRTKHDLKYLNWSRDASKVVINQNEYNELIDKMRGQGYNEIKDTKGKKTVRKYWFHKTFAVDNNGGYVSVYVEDDQGNLIIYTCAKDPEKQVRKTGEGGSAAYNRINDRMKEENGVSLRVAFGCADKEEIKNGLIKCNKSLPAIIAITQNGLKNTIIKNVYKADVSSAYPYQLTKTLPDLHKSQVVKGRAHPSSSFPFVFYMKSGHLAIYNELDTHDFEQDDLYKYRGKWEDCMDEDEVSLCCRASTYSLKSIMEDLYEGRKDDPANKTAMVTFIGYLRSEKYNRYNYAGHISAVTYARHIKAMLDYNKMLKTEHNYPILFATDSILWVGNSSKCTDQVKKLGAFVEEYAGARAVIKGCGVYAIEEKDGSLAVVKHQGTSAEEIKKKGIINLETFNNDWDESSLTTYFDNQSNTFTKETKELWELRNILTQN